MSSTMIDIRAIQKLWNWWKQVENNAVVINSNTRGCIYFQNTYSNHGTFEHSQT